MPLPTRPLLALLLCLILSGCLPSSCQREEDRSLFAADSASIALAETIAVDTLEVVWQSDDFDFPRTLEWGPDGSLWVVDAERKQALAFDGAGTIVQRIRAEVEAPYLAGFRGDSLALFQPSPAAFVVYGSEGDAPRRIDVPGLPEEPALLRYGSVWGDGFVFKGLSETTPPFLLTLDANGNATGRYTLPGPFWRYAGLMKPAANGDLLSLAGFRPVVDRVARAALTDTTARPDTLRLDGFSAPIPILARARRFAQGEDTTPPLLTASADESGEWLFVLNLRPGWLRIDAYDADGVLRYAFNEPGAQAGKNFYPRDIAVRQTGGEYHIAVAFTDPEPRVTVYRWAPGS